MQKNCTYFLSAFLFLSSSVQANTLDQKSTRFNFTQPVKLSDPSKQYTLEIGGRLHLDYNYAKLNDRVDEDDFTIRRARIDFKGKLKNWAYKTQFNLGNGQTGDPEDVYLRYQGWGQQLQLTIGNQKEPFGLEFTESSNNIVFAERSAITEEFVPGRSLGVQLSGQQDRFTYALGVFEDKSDDSGTGVTGRITYTPVHTDQQVLHLGLAYNRKGSERSVSGVELAYGNGPFHAQAEFMGSDTPDQNRSGGYLQAGWIITGEPRKYSRGAFRGVEPKGPSGAWEIVLRLEEGEGNFADTELGKVDASSFGLAVNYYHNTRWRVISKYAYASSNVNDDYGSEFRVRFQYVL